MLLKLLRNLAFTIRSSCVWLLLFTTVNIVVVLLSYMRGRNEVTIVAASEIIILCAIIYIDAHGHDSSNGGMTADGRTTRTSVHEAVMTEATRVGFYTDRLCGACYNASCHYNKNNIST